MIPGIGGGLAGGIAGAIGIIIGDLISPSSAEAPGVPSGSCGKGKWMCEGYAQYEIIGTNKHVIRGEWITAYGNTKSEAVHAWIKAVQASSPRGHTARHIFPHCRKIR